jgi:hypothetical protein
MIQRYGFTIRTRGGQREDNVSLLAATQEDAERRLRQMYVQCEILECRTEAMRPRLPGPRGNVVRLLPRAAPRERTGTH